MNLYELLGIVQNQEALYKVGIFLRWYETIALAGIVFAISEFMERDKLRSFIFKWSILAKIFLYFIISSIILTLIATTLPLFNTLYIIPLVSYPAFWELLALLFLSAAIILVLMFSLYPIKFIPSIGRKNCQEFFNNIYRVLLNEHDDESLAAVSSILKENLNNIFKYAAKYDRHWDIKGSPYDDPFQKNEVAKNEQELVQICIAIIDTAMSDKYYCRYLSENNIGIVLNIIDQTNENELWQSCGYFFYNSLCKELFLNEQSHLSRETEMRGEGLDKPVFKTLFCSFGIVSRYRVFQSFEWHEEENIKYDAINKYIHALEISIKCYFKSGSQTLMDTSIALSVAMESLYHILISIFLRLKKYDNDDIYHNKYEKVIRKIEYFYNITLKECLYGSYEYSPTFAKTEINVTDRSLTKSIVKAIFNYLDALNVLKNDDYARHLSTAVFWVIFSADSKRPDVINSMENKLLAMVKERVEENKKGFYPPMIRLLLNIYGFQFHKGVKDGIKIGKYIEKEFKNKLAADILSNYDKEKKFLPEGYKVNRMEKTIKDLHGYIIYYKD